MRPKHLIQLLTLLFIASPAFAKLEAHEWGTFTSLVGSDGRTQNGMYHEDEQLPGFVHGFGFEQNLARTLSLMGFPAEVDPTPPLPEPTPPPMSRPTPTPFPRPCRGKSCFDDQVYDTNPITQKMETPVIYFYTDQPQTVEVRVKFPQGVITESYPGPIRTSPKMSENLQLSGGDTTFKVDVLAETSGLVPPVSDDNIYSHARHVPQSHLVRSGADLEKFIFYRGLGRFQPNLSLRSHNGDLMLATPKGYDVPAAFLVNVGADGQFSMRKLGHLAEGSQLRVKASEIAALKEGRHQMTREHAQALMLPAMVAAGLNRAEAKAMLDTWEHGYLHVPGLRLLYILPVSEVNSILPLAMTPTPEKLARVFIGRLEILTDVEENRILQEILDQRENFKVQELGRFAESILRRILEVAETKPRATTDEDLRLIQSLIAKASHNELN